MSTVVIEGVAGQARVIGDNVPLQPIVSPAGCDGELTLNDWTPIDSLYTETGGDALRRCCCATSWGDG